MPIKINKSFFFFLASKEEGVQISKDEKPSAETEKPLYLTVLQLNKYAQTITKCLGPIRLPLKRPSRKVRVPVNRGESRLSAL